MAIDPSITPADRARTPGIAVDHLVDETGAAVPPPQDEIVVPAEAPEPRAAARTGPSKWWRLSLIGLGIVVAMLLVLQLMAGGPANTDVVPGTPASAPAPQSP
ncbi:hypothetical protein SAMN02983003_3425 [Devosia enhydra]|uniref:Uncharacterized protein n=1 Tax=Devosia enhydra TaxID=665118 RepID=A0A1K2I1W9_9HYPH|nr:hypothetical protein [Devosia enhydra]SFZ86247.1 hypothetical protein SAMN02983003_3425 [Devosia enhydra]